jgi:hypothetical protein
MSSIQIFNDSLLANDTTASHSNLNVVPFHSNITQSFGTNPTVSKLVIVDFEPMPSYTGMRNQAVVFSMAALDQYQCGLLYMTYMSRLESRF